MQKKVYLETHGCQMNVHDSEKALGLLASAGYESTQDPSEADLVLLNTCMVREKPEHKVFKRFAELQQRGRVGQAGVSGRIKPVYGVMGCVAQAEAERIFERNKDVRLVLGTQALGRLPDLLTELEKGFSRAIDVQMDKNAGFVELAATARQTTNVAYISIIEGCNKFCSFCIVPLTRGRERSRPAAGILAEAKSLAAAGFQEIQLLGQNVNSYGLSGSLRGNMIRGKARSGDHEISFVQLLDLLARESGVPRIKFTTSHPRDFDADVVRVIDAYENLCEWIHLPVQAGSDRMLRLMRRGYTRDDYLRKIEFIRKARKDIAITTDIIIGFPGESEADFEETLDLVAAVEFDGAYIFNYSPRPGTPASAYSDTVSPEVKSERFLRLQELQGSIQVKRNARYVGRMVEVLVEKQSARNPDDMSGHSRCGKVVNFRGGAELKGKRVEVLVEAVKSNSLYGRLLKY